MVIGVWNLTELIGAHSLKKVFVPALEANFLQKLPHSLEKWFVPALEANFLKKLPQLVALQIFQSSYLSHGESLNHN